MRSCDKKLYVMVTHTGINSNENQDWSSDKKL